MSDKLTDQYKHMATVDYQQIDSWLLLSRNMKYKAEAQWLC